MAVLSAIGSIISGNKQAKATKQVAQIGAENTAATNALAQGIYNENKATLSPYVQAGIPATGTLNGMLGLGTAEQQQGAKDAFGNYIKNSDYGFQFGNGSNALNSGYAASGTLQSGAAMKGLEGYRQNLQAGYRGEFMNALGNQQGLGLGAASAQAGVGQNFTNTIAANNANGASVKANAALAGANSPVANFMGQTGSFLQNSGIGNSLLKAIF